MTRRHECGGTYIGVSECTRREEYDGIGGGSKQGCRVTTIRSYPYSEGVNAGSVYLSYCVRHKQLLHPLDYACSVKHPSE